MANLKFIFPIILIIAVIGINADCGCLKCSKNVRVISSPRAPMKIIHRGTSCNCARRLPMSIETPVPQKCSKPHLRDYCYKCQQIKVAEPKQVHLYVHDAKIKKPVCEENPCTYLMGLVASPDRMVVPAQSCDEPMRSAPSPGPIFNSLRDIEDEDFADSRYFQTYSTGTGCNCQQRYERHKRSLSESAERNIDLNIRDIFYDGQSPTEYHEARNKLRNYKLRREMFKNNNIINLGHKLRQSIESGLKQILSRNKRDINFDNLYSVADVEDNEVQTSNSKVGQKPSDLFYDNFDWDYFIPQVPLFFFINTPVRMLRHFDKLKTHLEPVVENVPLVLRTSQKYFLNFGEKFKRSAYNFAQNFLKSFTRFKRSSDNVIFLNNLEVLNYKRNEDGTVDVILFNKLANSSSDLALVFENFTKKNPKMYFLKTEESFQHRHKRSLFKLVEEEELADLLRHKMGLFDDPIVGSSNFGSSEDIFEEHFNSIPKLREHFGKPKQVKVILERFDPSKVIRELKMGEEKPPLFDNIFSKDEIVGSKLFDKYRLRSKQPKEEVTHHFHPENNLDVIKNEISEILGEIQTLVHTDFDKDVSIIKDMNKLQNLKDTLVKDWKHHIKDSRSNDKRIMLGILTYIKDLEKIKSILIKRIGVQLSGRNFYNRIIFVKSLIQLYKLQTVFLKISEDLGPKIKTGTKLSTDNQNNYLKQLESITISSISDGNVLNELKEICNRKLEQKMVILEKLRVLLDHEEIDDEIRVKISDAARIIQESSLAKKAQSEHITELNLKIRKGLNYRREIVNILDLQKHITENSALLCKCKEEIETAKESKVKDSSDKKDDKLNIKKKVDEFVKSFESKRDEWLAKNKKLLEIKPKFKLDKKSS